MREFDQPVTELIRKRKSVRTYDSAVLPDEAWQKMNRFIEAAEGPFHKAVKITLLDRDFKADEGVRPGTYGLVRGARQYFVLTVQRGDRYALAEIGYIAEKCVLFAVSLGLGTCWLGGTFNKGAFAEAVDLSGEEIIPAVLPVGTPASKKSVVDKMMRTASGGDRRRNWYELFFDNDAETALRRDAAGGFSEALEMVRLAPSAMNLQPWRVIRRGDQYHFYCAGKNPGAHWLDMGIGMCHFDLTLREQGINGTFEVLTEEPEGIRAENLKYIATWSRL